MDVCVLIDERQVLSLLLGEPGFLLPPAILWAEDINHFPAIKDNDVFLGWVIAGFNQPLTLSFALLLKLAHCSFREVYLVAAITEKGREKYFLWHVRSVAEECGIFNEMSTQRFQFLIHMEDIHARVLFPFVFIQRRKILALLGAISMKAIVFFMIHCLKFVLSVLP